MNKKMGSMAMHMLLGLTLFAGTLRAEEEGEQERVPVGDRVMSKIEFLAVQEERAVRFAEQQEEEICDLEEEQGAMQRALKANVSRSIEGSNFCSTHQGAYHNPYLVSLLGETLELEDGSIWVVKKSDRYKTLEWLTSDSLVITPNHAWFSTYNYRITNLNTGQSIQVDLSLGPIYNGRFTHWVAAIDYYNGQICLEDGSIWDVSGFDQAVMNKWLLNDTVIIGIDDTLLGRTNILINVNTLNYVSTDCVY